MNPDAELLFHEVADLSPAERELYFRERLVPPDVRAEVEELLHFDSAKDDSLVAAVAAGADRLLSPRNALAQDRRCGPYRLVRILGRGGMGAVWLAERADGEVEQHVAIKFLRYASDEPVFVDRFLRERQILAQLNHPGIARLLDVGHTEEGQPYLAMDYVDGLPVDTYAHDLDLRGKLRLFIRVCDAVSYLHRNLIIHRDLKPSNILVNRTGEPKLLDFGIAKILDASADQTRTQERLLTPEYASPEQIQGAPQTTATDVYSLGAVLRKLLGDSAAPADLQSVLRKATRAEPEERYASVDALADDIRAFLESRPVRARSGNAWYRARKFLRRYWAPVAAAALVVASLSTGLYIADRERGIAQRRFAQVRQLAGKLIDLEGDIRYLPGATAARARIISTSLQYLAALGAEARGDASLNLEIAEAYWRVAGLQHQNFAQYAEAGETLNKAERFARAALAGKPRDSHVWLMLAEITHDRMNMAVAEEKREEKLAYGYETAARLDHVTARELTPELRRQCAGMYQNIGVMFLNEHRLTEALAYGRRALATVNGDDSLRGYRSLPLGLIANALRYLGDLNGALEFVRQACRTAEAAPPGSVNYELLYSAYWRQGAILGYDGEVSLNRPGEAIVSFQKAFDLAEGVATKDPNDHRSRHLLAAAGIPLGDILRHSDPQGALAVYDHAISRVRENANHDVQLRGDEAALLASSSYPARWLHRESEAKQRIGSALRLLRELREYRAEKIEPDGDVEAVLLAQADDLAESGQDGKAVKAYRELLDRMTATVPDAGSDLFTASHLSRIYAALAVSLARSGNSAEAKEFRARKIDLWHRWEHRLPNNSFVLRELAQSLSE